jgi:hypothetical protein
MNEIRIEDEILPEPQETISLQTRRNRNAKTNENNL